MARQQMIRLPGRGPEPDDDRGPAKYNPWTTAPEPEPAREEGPVHHRPIRHGAGVNPPAAQLRLPRRTLVGEELWQPVWFAAAHGGAGCTTLAALLGVGDAGRAWPVSSKEGQGPRVWLVAKATHSGLTAARAALTEWASGTVPVALEGAVLTAGAPKQPKELKPLVDLVRGAAHGAVWEIGWQQQWLLSAPELPTARQFRELQHVIEEQKRGHGRARQETR